MIKIAVIDDHIATRKGIQSIMPKDIRMVYDADNVDDLINNYKATTPDVVILDLSLDDKPGADTVKYVLEHCPDARILVYSMLDGIPGVSACYEAHAKAFISKGSSVEKLIEAIRQVASKPDKFYDSDIKEALLDYKFELSEHDPRLFISKKELEIFKYLANNKTVAEIAELMGISEKTIHNRAWDIGRKLNVKRHEFAEVARRYNIIH